jgi:hypothetical protein
VTVEAVLDGKVLARSVAATYRADLEAASVGTGRCGFDISFPDVLTTIDLVRVRVHVAGIGTALPPLGRLGEKLREAAMAASNAAEGTDRDPAAEQRILSDAPLLFTDLVSFSNSLVSLRPSDRVRLIATAVMGQRDELEGIVNLVFIRDRDPASFEAAMQMVGRKDPGHALAMRALAWHLNRVGRFAEAHEALATLLRARDAMGGDARRELMRLKLLMGELDEAGWEEALARLEPNWHAPAAVAAYRLQRLAEQDVAEFAREAVRLDAAIAAHPACRFEIAGAGATHEARGRYASALGRIMSARRVALVGNAPTLRDAEFGPEIDGHDCVIRINFPVISGFEKHVGHRTDVVIFSETYRGQLGEMMQRDPAYADVLAFGVVPERPPTRNAAGTLFPGLPSMPAELCALLAGLTYVRATTGLMAITLLGLVLKKQISLYGFAFFDPTQETHYYGQSHVFLGHEAAYERWYVRVLLDKLLPSMRFVTASETR